MTEPIHKVKSPAERNVDSFRLEDCSIASAQDAVTMERYVTLQPNPARNNPVYAMTPEMAIHVANALLEIAKRNSH